MEILINESCIRGPVGPRTTSYAALAMTKTISYRRHVVQAVVGAWLALGISNFAGASDVSRPLLYQDVEYRESKAIPLSVARTIDGKEVKRFSGVFGPALSPRGDEFAFIDKALKFVALDGTHRKTIEPRDLKTPGEQFHNWYPAWSPDGSRIAAITVIYGQTVGENEWAIVVFDTKSGRQISRHSIPNKTAAGCPYCMAWPNKFRWSPDGTKLLLSWGNTILIDLGEMKTQVVSDTWSSAEWGPSGDVVYYFEADREREGLPLTSFYIANLKTGKRELLLGEDSLAEIGITPSIFNYVPLLNSSPNGNHLVINSKSKSGGTTLRFFDLAKQARPDLRKPNEIVNVEDIILQLAWSPSARFIAALDATATTFRITKFDRTTGKWTVVSTLAWREDTPPELFAYKLLSWAE